MPNPNVVTGHGTFSLNHALEITEATLEQLRVLFVHDLTLSEENLNAILLAKDIARALQRGDQLP